MTASSRRGRRAAGTGEHERLILDAQGTQDVRNGTSGSTHASRAHVGASTARFEGFRQTERQFQAQVLRYAGLMGWSAYHTRDSRGSQAGFPDLVLTRRPRIFWAELKSERGRLSDDQKSWIEELRACGQAVFVWRPSDWQEIEAVLR